jgi:hypothetical protein
MRIPLGGCEEVMESESINETVLRYFRRELGVEEAADTIFRLQKAGSGFSLSPPYLSSLEKSEALMGRLLWLTLRELDPDAAPGTAFGAAEFREFQSQTEGERTGDEKPE